MKALLERRGEEARCELRRRDVNAAKTAGIVKHRDDFRQSPEFREIQKLAARKIADLASGSGKKTIIVDTTAR